MKVELIYNENNKAIGWSIDAATEHEKTIVNIIRDLQFFGVDETAIIYDGREGGDEKYAGKLMWVKKNKK